MGLRYCIQCRDKITGQVGDFAYHADIPDTAKQWHVKPIGEKMCVQCRCDNIRAGVRHRLREDETGYWYEKIIKVCFGTDTSIEVIKPRNH